MSRLRAISIALAALLLAPRAPGQAPVGDFGHGLQTAQATYPTQASVMAQITLQTESIVNSAQPILACGGSNAYSGNDVADSEWGTIAEITFWWYYNNGSAAGFGSLNQANHPAVTQATFQTFAQAELNFALGANGGYPCDLLDSAAATAGSPYLAHINGYQYSKYTSAETVVSQADYEETALSLIYKAIIQQYNTTPAGVSLFGSAQLATMLAGAQSNWSWLTIDAVYNPEHTSNQVIMAVSGGYWLGLVNNSPGQMSAALNYYDGPDAL